MKAQGREAVKKGAGRGRALRDYLLAVSRLPRLEDAERAGLATRWKAGDAEAGRRLMEGFLPLVVAEAAVRRGLGARFDALLKAGNQALARCLPRLGAAPDMEAAVRGAVVRSLRSCWMEKARRARM